MIKIMSNSVWRLFEERLRWTEEQLAKALDHVRRLERRQAGLPEMAPQQGHVPQRPTLTPGILDITSKLASDSIRAKVEMDIQTRLAAGVPAEQIEEELRRIVEAVEEVA
ncbi:MAG TPA: hypothetical protein VNZ57_14660 [Longimicrobiales bacterium]|nr:hypothetical protein [Longimicrobiales bacterium]